MDNGLLVQHVALDDLASNTREICPWARGAGKHAKIKATFCDRSGHRRADKARAPGDEYAVATCHALSISAFEIIRILSSRSQSMSSLNRLPRQERGYADRNVASALHE